MTDPISTHTAGGREPAGLLNYVLRIAGALIAVPSALFMTREAVVGPISFWFLLGGVLFGLIVAASGWMPSTRRYSEALSYRPARERVPRTSRTPKYQAAHVRVYDLRHLP